MNVQRFRRTLDELEAERVPSDLDLWPGIRSRLGAHTRPGGARWLPASRLGWAVAGLVVFLALGTAAYAMAPLLSRAFQMEPGLRQIDEAHLGQEIKLSQTVDGFTVTLQRVYADANRIVLGYIVTGPGGKRFNNFSARDMTLTGQDGTVFPHRVGLGAGVVDGTGAYVASFDSAVRGEHPAMLHLHLDMQLTGLPAEAFAPSEATPTPLATVGAVRLESGVTIVELAPLPEGLDVEAGPFSFDLDVPFTPDRWVVDAPQTVEVGGIVMTLERVVVTPSETRATLRFDPPVVGDAQSRRWVPIVSLEVNSGRDRQVYQADTDTGEGAFTCGVLAPLYGHEGEWPLKVSELVGFDETGATEDVRVAGPWVFRFRVP